MINIKMLMLVECLPYAKYSRKHFICIISFNMNHPNKTINIFFILIKKILFKYYIVYLVLETEFDFVWFQNLCSYTLYYFVFQEAA